MPNLYNVPLQNGIQRTLANTLNAGEVTTITFATSVSSVLQASASIPGTLVIDRVDSNGNLTPSLTEYISFTGVSGSTVTGLVRGLAGTSDIAHSIGAIVEFVPDVTWADAINDTFTVGHNADGTHKSSAFSSLVSLSLTNVSLFDSTLDSSTFNSNKVATISNVSGYVNNILISNSLTNVAPTLRSVGSDTNIDFEVRGKGDGLLRFPVVRQNNTTNEYINSQVMQTGWGFIANTATNFISETVTFGKSFATLPIIIATSGGDSSSGTTYGSGGNNVTGPISVKVSNVTTTQFSVFIHTSTGGNFVTPGNSFYHWVAVGTV